MAWLSSSPKSLQGSNAKKKRRIDTLSDDSRFKKLPSANSYLVECFELAGCYLSVGMGMFPLSWVEIESFSSKSAHHLECWESEIIHEMSREYCNMHSKADGENCAAPYSVGISGNKTEVQKMRDRVDQQLDQLFS